MGHEVYTGMNRSARKASLWHGCTEGGLGQGSTGGWIMDSYGRAEGSTEGGRKREKELERGRERKLEALMAESG